MFGAMMNQMNAMQEQMKKHMSDQSFTAEAGVVAVTCDGNRNITNISIKPEGLEDTEELEDLLLVAINRALENAATYEAEQAGGMMKNMLPGGLGGLLG
jgi:DNA-binding YbaB/EbfC family protein